MAKSACLVVLSVLATALLQNSALAQHVAPGGDTFVVATGEPMFACHYKAPYGCTKSCSNGQPVCASGACKTTHSDGLGQDFYDCNPLDTYTSASAIEAGTAYEISIGGTGANVSDGWSCPGSALISVCATNTGGNPLYCWGHEGSEAGQVAPSQCPWDGIGTWN
jgi:hypothetical protein